jgi:hypothetical protein
VLVGCLPLPAQRQLLLEFARELQKPLRGLFLLDIVQQGLQAQVAGRQVKIDVAVDWGTSNQDRLLANVNPALYAQRMYEMQITSNCAA